ncbi:Alpha/Beta hydrolase protein [Dimargaris cristalligena]|uniref:Alpha/Beta hydrolase protein n=1 Tax=Dimargaris cristalligena TaxID=215637 RepID=A0A4Q0A107_9FUNG|nr:Alpha/Beta hydrolase protein [Dimargaris cristalligena]|eukprot:RKP39786.1 Alpha/Beta hydrolase protein [Dimargaris cristalligena]
MGHKDILLKGKGTSGAQLEYVFMYPKEPAINGYISTDAKAKTITIAFKGTDTSSDLLTALHVTLTSWPANTASKVYSGALNGYQTHGPAIVAEHKKLAAQHPEYRSVITGHSLGALHATLYAFDNYGTMGSAPWEVITFAAPKVGNDEFRRLWQAKGIPTARVVNPLDIVVHWPFWGNEFCHVSPPVLIDEKTQDTFRCTFDSTPDAPEICQSQSKIPGINLKEHGEFWGNDGTQLGPKN